jgi:CRP-like cAMP-binding protein
MPNPVDVRKLKDQLEKAQAKDKRADVAKILAELERAEPDNPGWSHRLGDAERRQGNTTRAVLAYERAVRRYEKGGFLARAVAMAKTILTLDPKRTDVLESIQQDDARDVSRKSRAGTQGSVSPASVTEQASMLEPATDVAPDEVRFADQPDTEVVFDLTAEELEILDVEWVEPAASAEKRTAERLSVLPLFALFAEVPRAALMAMAEASELVELGPGDTVVRAGDMADALYAIVQGSVRVVIPGLGHEVRQSLREGEVFGEACLLTDEPRHADVVVDEPLTALRIPKQTLDELVKAHAEVGAVLMNLLTRRLLVNLIKTSPLFAALDVETRRELARMFELRKAERGTVLAEIGKRGDGLYIPLTGMLEVTGDGGTTRSVSAGALVGQGSLLGQRASRVSVRTRGDTLMLRLSSSRFMELVTQFPTVLEQLSAIAVTDTLS